MLDELMKLDLSFSESMFKTKVDNIFIMLLTSFMMKDMMRVKHVISSELYDKYTSDIVALGDNRQMYEQLNVASTEISNVQITDEKYIINVIITSKAIDYIMNSKGTTISGNDKTRTLKTNYLTFTKKRQTKNLKEARKCPGCGANIDTNYNGICAYCGNTYNTLDYDWVLESMIVA